MERRLHLIAAVLLLFFSAAGVSAAQPHYAMDLVVDFEAGVVSGTLSVHYWNMTGIPQTELFFRLHPNATHIYGSASLNILSVTADGLPVEPQLFVEDTVLLVPLAQALAPGSETTVTLTFEAMASLHTSESADQPSDYGILTKSQHALVLTAFYPILAPYTDEGWAIDPPFPIGDALMAEAASYDVKLQLPGELQPITSGRLAETSSGEGTMSYRYTVDAARDFSIVIGSALAEQSSSVRSKTLRTWFAAEHEEASRRALDVASASLELYELLVGACPYDEIDLVEVPLHRVAGVEFAGLILVSSGYAANPATTFFDVIISHEMAHQWFYAGVGNDPIEEPWLDESLATYLSYLFLEAAALPGIGSAELASWERAYQRARAAHPDLAISRPLYDFPDSSTYSAFVYSGGAVMLDAIRREIGDEAFFAALATYFETYEFEIAPGSAWIAVLEDACRCSLAPILSSFRLVP